MNRSPAASILAANAALVGGRQLDAVAGFVTPDYVAHATRHDLKGHAAIRRFVATRLRVPRPRGRGRDPGRGARVSEPTTIELR